jgi:hypothetical protein
MSKYSDLNYACLESFNDGPFTFTPASTGTPQSIPGIFSRPPIEEPNTPGSALGVSIIYLWVFADSISPRPQMGDSIIVNAVKYDIGAVYTDLKGGATLRLGRNS